MMVYFWFRLCTGKQGKHSIRVSIKHCVDGEPKCQRDHLREDILEYMKSNDSGLLMMLPYEKQKKL